MVEMIGMDVRDRVSGIVVDQHVLMARRHAHYQMTLPS